MDGAGNHTAFSGASVVNNILIQSGIKGMKWGITRRRGPGGTVSSNPNASDDYTQALSARSKPASSLSNQDMQSLITRMNLEKQYSQLTATIAPPTKKAKVGKFVRELMIDIGSSEIRRVSKGAAAIQVETALGKGNSRSKAVAKRITPGKKKEPEDDGTGPWGPPLTNK